MNVAFTNGTIVTPDKKVFIYYASSDTRLPVATSTVDQLADYAMHTPADPLRIAACVAQRNELIDRNPRLLDTDNNAQFERINAPRASKL